MKTELISTRPVTEFPIFDVGLAMSSKEQATHLFAPYMDCLPAALASLNVAGALALYNFEKNAPQDQKGALRPVLKDRLLDLAQKEVLAVDKELLPTVGFEIETPAKPFLNKRNIFGCSYRPFFDSIGMPRNLINTDGHIKEDAVQYWEFAPLPSYSAGVQQRIISELIQGGFIPHLVSSQEPKDIQSLLDDHLVSLHVNIGIPSDVDMSTGLPKNQAEILGTALAVAYTSPLRIQERKQKQTQFAQVKSASPTLKTTDMNSQPFRIELKAMEARTAAMYRALPTAQLLFASLFSHSSLEPDDELSYFSRQTTKGIQEISGYHFFYPRYEDPTGNNYEVARLAGRGDTANEMRAFLEDQAKKVSTYLNFLEPQLPAQE